MASRAQQSRLALSRRRRNCQASLIQVSAFVTDALTLSIKDKIKPTMCSLNRALSKICIAACLVSIATLVHAEEKTDENYASSMRYASLDAMGDSESRQVTGTASVSLGRFVWIQGSGGRLTDNSEANVLGDLSSVGAGAGFKNQFLQLQASFSKYKNDESYDQRDVNASLSWLGERVSVGLDVFRRDTDNSVDTVRNFPTLGLSNVALHISESFNGSGVGLHADFNVTDDLTLMIGGMSYDYDSDYTITSSSNPILIRQLLVKRPTLSELLYLDNSGVTRSLALLESSYNAGLRYQFTNLAVSAQYFRDSALDSDDVTSTGTLGLSIFIGDHWVVAPSYGYSSSSEADSVSFGSLSLAFNW